MSARVVWGIVTSLLASLTPQFSANAQQVPAPTEIPSTPSCTSCRLTVKRIAKIGPKDGPGALEMQPFEVVVDRKNRYWVSGTGAPILYDSLGNYIRPLGRLGDGPDEYRGPTIVREIARDTTLVFDIRRADGRILSSDLSTARTLTLTWSGLPTSFVNVGNVIIGAGAMETPESAGLPLHVLSTGAATSNVVKSFGIGRENIAGGERMLQWKLGPGLNSTFWSADIKRYRLANWSANGTLLRQFIRKPSWFRDTSVARPINGTTPPDPIMTAVAQDSQGLVWVAALAASPDWKSGWIAGKNPPARGTFADARPSSIYDFRKIYMTQIEVIDPGSGRLVATLSMQQHIVSMLPGRRAAVYSEDADGFPVLEVVEFTLIGR